MTNEEKRTGWWWHRTIDRDAAGNFKGLRAWLHRRTGGQLSLELAVKSENRGVGIHVDGGDGEVGGHIAVGGLWLSVSSERLAPDLLYRALGVYFKYDPDQPFDHDRFRACNRAIDLSVHSGSLWWTLWMNRDEWSSRDPKWRRGHFNPIDFLLGPAKFTTRIERTEDIEIPLPEGMRPALIQWKIHTAVRPRWPWPVSHRSAEVAPEKPVGIPGKGENSWDIGDDAIFSQSTDARDNEEAIARFVESVLRSRRRHGGSHRWQATEGPGAEAPAGQS